MRYENFYIEEGSFISNTDTFLNAEKYVFSDQSPDNDPKPDQVTK